MNSSLEGEVSSAKWSLWISPIVGTAYLGCLVCLGLRHRHNIEPVHILELNTLLDITVVTITTALQNLDYFLQADLYCIIIHALKRWAKFSFFADFSLGEIDKFLSLHWSASYKVRVSNKRALILIIIVKILLIPVTVTAALLDTDYLRCSREYLHVCSNFKSTNFYWTTFPMVICSTVTIAVSIYTFRVARRLASTVTPVVNIPVIPTISAAASDRQQVACRIVPPLGHVISNAWTSELVQTAKTAVKFNTISLCSLGLCIPENIVTTWVFFSGTNCKNDPDFPSRVKSIMLFQIIFVFMYPYLIMRKLQNFL